MIFYIAYSKFETTLTLPTTAWLVGSYLLMCDSLGPKMFLTWAPYFYYSTCPILLIR